MIHIIVGTKAQLVKMAPVMSCLVKHGVPYNFIYTGQHQDTIDEMIVDFGLKLPDVVLYSGKDITSVFSMLLWSIRIFFISLVRCKTIFYGDKNGIVLVHGDTLSTLLGALMGKLARLKVGHVESGLRSYNIFHPFPEEITRIITFRISDILFCPGQWAMKNISNLNKEKVNTHANTLYDCLPLGTDCSARTDHIPGYPFVLVSLHRYENIFNKKRFEKIIFLLDYISLSNKIVFIMHPPTEKQIHRMGLYDKLSVNENICFRSRYNHSDFISLLKKTEFVVTDGGSLQEETYYLGIPCLLFRKATERQEGLGGNVVLSNYDIEIVKNFCQSYASYKHNFLQLKTSPSDVILRSIKKYA